VAVRRVRPGARANAARDFVRLGKDKLGKGRALLERARTASEAGVRELARATVLAIDGPSTPTDRPGGLSDRWLRDRAAREDRVCGNRAGKSCAVGGCTTQLQYTQFGRERTLNPEPPPR
jgi:hypothetical protein